MADKPASADPGMDAGGESVSDKGGSSAAGVDGWVRIIPDASTTDVFKYRTFAVWTAPEDCLVSGLDFQFAFVPKKGAKGTSGCTVALVRVPRKEDGPRQPPHFESLQQIPPDWVLHWTTFPVTCSEAGMVTAVHRLEDTWKTVGLRKDDSLACFVKACQLVNPWFHLMGNLEMRLKTAPKDSNHNSLGCELS